MGLIKWVKDQYYNYKLNQADSYAEKGQFDKAEMNYTAILENQEWAVVHLVKMLAEQSDSIDKQIACLRRISELAEYKTEINQADYQKEFESHLSKMEMSAAEKFNQKDYTSAVLLAEALLEFRDTTKQKDNFHRYKAYKFFSDSQKNTYVNCKSDIDNVVSEFNLISSFPEDDLRHICSILFADSKFARAIYLLLSNEGKSVWINEEIVSCIIKVISSSDNELKTINTISSICSSTYLAKQTATKLVSLSTESAKKRDYKTCVLFDKYAAEYFSEENQFNNNRCIHILEELSSRANAKEISDLIKLAQSLGLSDSQISALKRRIEEIANQADGIRAINICKLFLDSKAFGKIYIDKALKLCQQQASSINTDELRRVIKSNTTEASFPDYLGKFVNKLSAFEREFYESAISKILRENSVNLLKTYWSIKPNVIFFEKLISSSVNEYESFVAYIVTHHSLFIKTSGFKKAFFKALLALDNEEYILKTSESLLNNGCDIKEFYETTILGYAKRKNDGQALLLLNHALTIVESQKFIEAKKIIIRNYINSKNFDIAERESKSLNTIDEESWTLLAEVYFANAESINDKTIQIDFYEKVVELSKAHELYNHFKSKLEKTFVELSNISLTLYSEGLHERAYSICDSISCNQTVWLTLYTTLRGKDGESLTTIGQKIKHIEGTLETIKQIVDKEIALKSNSYNNLWLELSTLNIEKAKSQPKDKAIRNLENFRTGLLVNCIEKIRDEESGKLTNLIVKYKWSYAQELEREELFAEAASMYESTACEKNASYQKRADFRALISKLKAGGIDSKTENAITTALKEKSFESLREDLAYRYACYLIKSIRPADAENIIKTYLPEEKSLLKICTNIYVKEAEIRLAGFNEKLMQISQGTMTTKEAMNFLQDIDRYKSEISTHLTDTSAKFGKYKVQVKAYILKCFFNDENYIDAYKALIAMHPNFIDNEVAYRNIAVASIGIIESDIENDQMLRKAVSIALSAIYSDKLFVKSLEQTSWDDQYEFTLEDSLGQSIESNYDELPDNVNFNSPIENQIIAIKDVQNNLLIRVETAIRENHASLESFYQGEKQALDKLLELNLDEDFYIATPGFAAYDDSIKTNIKEALDFDYNQGYGNQEDVLAVGLMYGFIDGEYYTYKVAKDALEKCRQSLMNTNSTSQIKTTLSSKNISSIREFDKLYADLCAACSSAMNASISSKMAFDKFLDYYEIICKAINDVRMSMTCANYVNGAVIQKLNNDSMKLRDGIGYMVRIYNLAPSNVQVKNNLEGILNNLVLEAEQSGNSMDKSAITKAQRDLNGKYDTFISEAKVQAALSIIVDKVNGGSMKKNKALEEVYKLYKNQPNNPRICQNLATLCDMCIMEYVIQDSWGASSVKTVLNSLKNNMSSTFKQNSSTLAKSYHDIWGQLSTDNKRLLSGLGGLYGQSLNDKGLALKEGLEYLKTLGGVRSNGLTDIFF